MSAAQTCSGAGPGREERQLNQALRRKGTLVASKSKSRDLTGQGGGETNKSSQRVRVSQSKHESK